MEENDVLPTTSHIISSNFIISCCTISKGVHVLLHILRHKLEARVILPHEDVSRMNRINCMREILKHNNITTWIVFKIRDAIFSYFIQATRNVRFLALMLQSFINCICTLKYMFSCNFFMRNIQFQIEISDKFNVRNYIFKRNIAW